MTRLTLLVAALLACSCAGDGHLCLLGYTTQPNYDTNIRTIYLPIFENITYYRGMEFDLHKALQNAIHTRTPYRITSNRAGADTELTGKIVNFLRNVPLINPNNSPRSIETTLTVELTWTDLRTGEVLSRRQRRPGEPVPLDLPPPGAGSVLPGVAAPVSPTPFVQDAAPQAGGPAIDPRPAPPPGPAVPVLINATTTYHPELAESLTTGQLRTIDKMAVQITNMMQTPW